MDDGALLVSRVWASVCVCARVCVRHTSHVHKPNTHLCDKLRHCARQHTVVGKEAVRIVAHPAQHRFRFIQVLCCSAYHRQRNEATDSRNTL
jgi:hypothetical protein